MTALRWVAYLRQDDGSWKDASSGTDPKALRAESNANSGEGATVLVLPELHDTTAELSHDEFFAIVGPMNPELLVGVTSPGDPAIEARRERDPPDRPGPGDRDRWWCPNRCFTVLSSDSPIVVCECYPIIDGRQLIVKCPTIGT